MSDKATMLQETVEAFADLRTMLDGLTEEQARRIRLGVLGVRDLVIQWPGMLRGCGGQMSQAASREYSQSTYVLGARLLLGAEVSGRSKQYLINAAGDAADKQLRRPRGCT
jgi:hypothetical protein